MAFGVILSMIREKIHKKYIQIIGHRKRKVIGVLIMGILGMGFIIFFIWHLKTQYDISRLLPSSKVQINTVGGEDINTVQEGL